MGVEIFFGETRKLARRTERRVQAAQATGSDTVAAFDAAIAALTDGDAGVVGQLTRIRDGYSTSLTRACTAANGLAGVLQGNVTLYEDYNNGAASILNGLSQGLYAPLDSTHGDAA